MVKYGNVFYRLCMLSGNLNLKASEIRQRAIVIDSVITSEVSLNNLLLLDG